MKQKAISDNIKQKSAQAKNRVSSADEKMDAIAWRLAGMRVGTADKANEIIFDEWGAHAELPLKDHDWLNAQDLAKAGFLASTPNTIETALKKYQHENSELIQECRDVDGVVSLCLLRDGLGWLRRRIEQDNPAGKDIPEKTDKWDSTLDLADMGFVLPDHNQLKATLKKYQHEKPEYIQERRDVDGKIYLCLHHDGRNWLQKRAEQEQLKEKGILEKTDDWENVLELRNDPDFAMGHLGKIEDALKKYQHENPELIQNRFDAADGKTYLCLHRDGRDWLLGKLGIKNVPPHTSEWFSAHDLVSAKKLPRRKYEEIKNALAKYQHENPELIQERRFNYTGRIVLCVHEKGVEWLKNRLNQDRPLIDVPEKTGEWQNAKDLAKEDDFGFADITQIQAALKELQHEKPEYIQERRATANSYISLCLNRDGRQWFLERLRQQEKKNSIRRAATVLNAGASVIDTATTIKSTTTDKAKKK